MTIYLKNIIQINSNESKIPVFLRLNTSFDLGSIKINISRG